MSPVRTFSLIRRVASPGRHGFTSCGPPVCLRFAMTLRDMYQNVTPVKVTSAVPCHRRMAEPSRPNDAAAPVFRGHRLHPRIAQRPGAPASREARTGQTRMTFSAEAARARFLSRVARLSPRRNAVSR